MASASRGGVDKQAALEKEAKELMKKAKALTGPSILELRFKPDWEAAAPLLDKAALAYKQAGNIPKALEAYERAGSAQERLGSQWHAAKHYEVAAELSRKIENYKDVAKYYKMAATMFVESGKHTSACECLTRGARALEGSDDAEAAEEAARLYYDALDIYESEGKEAYAVDAFRYAIGFLVQQQRWDEAVEVQMRFGAASDKVGARYSQAKAYLGAVVTWLYAQDAEKAWHTFQDAMAVDSFANSEEAFAADALLEAYRQQDEEGIKAMMQKKPCFKQLDNQVARLALKLPTGKLRRMARKLNKLMAAGEEEGEGGEGEEEPAYDEDGNPIDRAEQELL